MAIDEGNDDDLVAYRLPPKLQGRVHQGDYVTAAITKHLGCVRAR